MCAAVSDYTPENQSDKKIKSKTESLSMKMVPTTDIIKSISKEENHYAEELGELVTQIDHKVDLCLLSSSPS